MKKSSLGRRSGIPQATTKKTKDFFERKEKQVPSRTRNLSADRMVQLLPRNPSSDRISQGSLMQTPLHWKSEGTARPSRAMTMSTSSDRRSSIGGQKKKDNRPLQDKEWQLDAVEQIHDFMQHDLEGITLLQNYKSVKNMSLNFFIALFNYWLRFLDPNFTAINKVNWMNEVPYFLKKLEYKGKIEKSILQTVAAMHSWPYVLGIHHFMMRLASSMKIFQNIGNDALFPFSNESEQDNAIDSKLITKFAELSYKNYQDTNQSEAEREKKQEIIETEILQEAGLTSDIMDEIKLVEENNDSFKKRIESLETKYRSQNDEVKCLKTKVQDVDSKIEFEEQNINKLKEKLRHSHSSLQNLQKECQSLECELESKEEAKLKLQEHQEQDKEMMKELKKTKDRKKLLQKEIAFEKEYITSYENEVYSVDLNLADIQKKINNTANEYNNIILKMMKIVPSVKEAVIHDQPQNTSSDCFAKMSNVLLEVKSSLNKEIKELSDKEKCLIEQREKELVELIKIDESLKSKSEELDQLKLELQDLEKKTTEVFEQQQDLNNKKILLGAKKEEICAKGQRLSKKLSECRELNKGRSEKLEKVKCVLKQKIEILNQIFQEAREFAQKAIEDTLKV